MKLISMTDFVIDQNIRYANSEIESEDLNRLIWNYAHFLKQPLKLEMFVPYDDEGNVLEEPRFVSPDGVKWDDYVKQYQQAKEKVLFDGLTIQTEEKWIEFYGGIRVFQYEKEKEPHKWFGHVFREFDTSEFIVEDLVKYGLQLTESAKKQISL